MSDAPPFDGFLSLCNPEDDIQFDIVWEGLDFGQQQQLPMSPYSVTPQTGHPNGGHDFRGQLQFEYHDVPFPATHQNDHLRNGLPRIDTNALGPPPAQTSSDHSSASAGSMIPLAPHNSWMGNRPSRLQVHIPGRTLPSGTISYPTFSPINPKGLSPIPSPRSPHSAAMGSSDEGSFDQTSDDDEEDAPQPMEHVVKWKSIRELAVVVTGTNVYIPQLIYQPYTEADRVRYIEKVDLKEPIVFMTAHPDQWGIALDDAIKAKMKNLLDKDDSMLEDCGPSVSIRLQWPGYRAWTKQIPTMDFKSPKGPITRAKLAKTIANCVGRFIDEKEKERMEMEVDRQWRVGTRYIRMADLILVSLHHISRGSWQPQLRLRTPLSEIQLRRTLPSTA
ncbi:hypothetical protein DFH29DRAFT_993362 [Suillus ampliporus]|nr:hypothetical protein DFH29DRAFT_993362 [Suillus ampliporus]